METTKQTATKSGFTEAGIMTQPPDYILRDKTDEPNASDYMNDSIVNDEGPAGTDEDKEWVQRKTNETMM
ncbi:MAG: hypothetical protein JST55_14025 [Bacteroidetes bacterium]|nr:hypothetical protein [Bacteroidota bacterium]